MPCWDYKETGANVIFLPVLPPSDQCNLSSRATGNSIEGDMFPNRQGWGGGLQLSPNGGTFWRLLKFFLLPLKHIFPLILSFYVPFVPVRIHHDPFTLFFTFTKMLAFSQFGHPLNCTLLLLNGVDISVKSFFFF